MEVRLFSDYRMQDLEDKINEFLSTLKGEVVSIKYAISSAPDGDGYVCDRYSALVLYREKSGHYINKYGHDLMKYIEDFKVIVDNAFTHVAIDSNGRIFGYAEEPVRNIDYSMWLLSGTVDGYKIGTALGEHKNWQELIWEIKNTNR